jgi:hypothetical protein
MSPGTVRGGTSTVRAHAWRSILGALVVLVSCGGGGGGEDGYGADHRDDFVADCETGGVSTQVCGCFYDRLAAEVPFERFQTVDGELQDPPADPPADLAALAAACAAEPESADGG